MYSIKGKLARCGVILMGVAVMLPACSSDYTVRQDPVSLDAGDAVERNKIAQIIDPWPRNTGNTRILYNGERMLNAVENYVNPVKASNGESKNSPTSAPASPATK